MYRPSSNLSKFIFQNNYELETDPGIAKFFYDLKKIIDENNCINEIWYAPSGKRNRDFDTYEPNNLLTHFCFNPKIIKKLLIMRADPNILFEKNNSTFYHILGSFIRLCNSCFEYELHGTDRILRISKTIKYILNYNVDPTKFNKSQIKLNKSQIKFNKSMSSQTFDINFFLMIFHQATIYDRTNNEHFIIFINVVRYFILKLNKYYLQDNKIRIIPANLVRHSMFSLNLDEFGKFQMNQNNLNKFKKEKEYLIDKFKITICFNVLTVYNKFFAKELKFDKIYNIVFEYKMNESNFKNIQNLI